MSKKELVARLNELYAALGYPLTTEKRCQTTLKSVLVYNIELCEKELAARN